MTGVLIGAVSWLKIEYEEGNPNETFLPRKAHKLRSETKAIHWHTLQSEET